LAQFGGTEFEADEPGWGEPEPEWDSEREPWIELDLPDLP
jgi:hypothetical protein